MERMPPARGPPLPCAARVCGTGVRSTHLARPRRGGLRGPRPRPVACPGQRFSPPPSGRGRRSGHVPHQDTAALRRAPFAPSSPPTGIDNAVAQAQFADVYRNRLYVTRQRCPLNSTDAITVRRRELDTLTQELGPLLGAYKSAQFGLSGQRPLHTHRLVGFAAAALLRKHMPRFWFSPRRA